jgi:hypothetical protein
MSQGQKNLPCKVVNGYTLLLTIDNLPSGSDYLNTIAVLGLTNPNTVTSTGIFSLRVLKGTVNEYDREYAFGQLGFTPAPVAMGATSILVTANDGPNLLATYRLSVTFAAGSITSNATIRVRVPPALTIDPTKVVVTTVPSLGASVTTGFYRNYIILKGLTQQTIPNLDITVQNLQNPPYSGNAGSFAVELRANGTEQVIETGTVGPAMVSVAMIPSQNVILTSFGIDVSSMTLFSGDTIDYEISAKILNTLPDDCGITVEVPSAFTSITRCWGMTNLVDLSATAPITCTVVGNFLKLNNLKTIYKFKSIKIGMTVTNPVVAVDTVTGNFNVYTYADRTFLKMVDQSSTPVTITIKGTAGVASVVTVTTTPIPSFTVLTTLAIEFKAGQTFTSLSAKIMLAPGFINTNSVTNQVTCRVDKNGAAFIAAGTCTALINSLNFLEINMVTTPNMGAAVATDTFLMTLTPIASKGIQTPTYAGGYFAQVVLSEAGTPAIYGTAHFNVNELNFNPALMAVIPYTYDYAHVSVYDFSVYLPFAVEQGQWIPKDDIGITFFEIRFSGTSFSGVIGTNPANAAIPCYGVVGLSKYHEQTGSMSITQ